MVATVAAYSMKPLLDYVVERGQDPRALVRPFGLELDYFDDPHARLPVAVTDRMWEQAAVLCGDANLALHVTARIGPGKNGVLSYLVAHSATLEAALERLVRFFPLISSHTRYRLEPARDRVRVVCELNRPCLGRQSEEVSMGAVANFGRQRCGPRFMIARASFRSPPPSSLDEHHELFGQAIEFNAPATWVELTRELLRLPVSSADEQLATLLEVAARREPPSADGRLPDQVRLQMAALLSTDRPARCEHVASRLAMSPRTLRRKLAEHGASYRGLLDEVLSQLAAPLLGDDQVPIEDVVARLQFSDLRALANATRRWFGLTPQQYRRLNMERTRI